MKSNSFCEKSDLLWSVFNSDLMIDYGATMSVATRVLNFFSDKSVDCVEILFLSFISRLNDLNNRKFVMHVEECLFCRDEFDFLNLRTAIIVMGEKFYCKIIEGDYSSLSLCELFANPMRKLFYEIIGALNAFYINAKQLSIGDLSFYSDEIFIDLFRVNCVNDFPLNLVVDRSIVDYALKDTGEILHEYESPDLGVIRAGNFLRHVKLGILWIYRINVNSKGGVRIDAMFKERHTSILLIEGSGLLTLA